LHAVDERIVGTKPKNADFPTAAAIPLVGLTAWEGLFENMHIPLDKNLNKGKTILVVGGAGGVGSIAVQLAKKVAGLTVIASASRKETEAYSKKMGADFVINHKNSLKDEL